VDVLGVYHKNFSLLCQKHWRMRANLFLLHDFTIAPTLKIYLASTLL